LGIPSLRVRGDSNPNTYLGVDPRKISSPLLRLVLGE